LPRIRLLQYVAANVNYRVGLLLEVLA
jgi:hypothetical protein